jgi:hypothetical protein
MTSANNNSLSAAAAGDSIVAILRRIQAECQTASVHQLIEDAVQMAKAVAVDSNDDAFIIAAVQEAKLQCVIPDSDTTLSVGRTVLAAHRRTLALGSPLPPAPFKWPNGCDGTIPSALRYLAGHPRPSGGESTYNSAHLFQLADEMDRAVRNSRKYQAPLTASETPLGTPLRPDTVVTALRECAEGLERLVTYAKSNAVDATKTTDGRSVSALTAAQDAAIRVRATLREITLAGMERSSAVSLRTAELESVLESVQEQFNRFGQRLPDGFDTRLFRWVDDALAGAQGAADGIVGPITNSQRNETRALLCTLTGLPLDTADVVISRAAGYGYLNGRRDFTAPPGDEGQGSDFATPGMPDDIRAAGWTVAAHSDYRLNEEPHTCWLFTKGSRNVRGEAKTDAEALDKVRQEIVRLDAEIEAHERNNR